MSFLPKSERESLTSMFSEMNGENWSWFTNENEAGVPWNIQDLTSDPCMSHWQGIVCSCVTNYSTQIISRTAQLHLTTIIIISTLRMRSEQLETALFEASTCHISTLQGNFHQTLLTYKISKHCIFPETLSRGHIRWC